MICENIKFRGDDLEFRIDFDQPGIQHCEVIHQSPVIAVFCHIQRRGGGFPVG